VDVFERLRNAGSPGDLLTDVMLRGCGYGDDGPRIGPEPDRDGLEGIRLERGSVWTCKLSTHAANDEIRFVWGTTVLATADGGALLSPRPPTILSV
jgi:hypothetical protein